MHYHAVHMATYTTWGPLILMYLIRQACMRAVKVYFCYTCKFRKIDPDQLSLVVAHLDSTPRSIHT
jgi:hypothetical protein